MNNHEPEQEGGIEFPVKRTPKKIGKGFFDTFRCSFCFEYFDPPVYECRNREFICHSCILVSQDKRWLCPCCRQEICTDTPNRLIERQMSDLQIACRWRKKGCKEILSISQFRSHIRKCKFAHFRIVCYYHRNRTGIDCNWQGLDIVRHLIEDHGHEVYAVDVTTNAIEFSYVMPQENTPRSSQKILKLEKNAESLEEKYFILEFFYNSDLEIAIFMIRALDLEDCFRFEFSVFSVENEKIGIQRDVMTCNFQDRFPRDYPYISPLQHCCVSYNKLRLLRVQRENCYFFSFEIKFNITL